MSFGSFEALSFYPFSLFDVQRSLEISSDLFEVFGLHHGPAAAGRVAAHRVLRRRQARPAGRGAQGRRPGDQSDDDVDRRGAAAPGARADRGRGRRLLRGGLQGPGGKKKVEGSIDDDLRTSDL